jgi:Flp pilus assembly pilin Flp
MQDTETSRTRFAVGARRLGRDRRGAVAVEYGLLAGMIVIALIGMSSLSNVADSQNNSMNAISTALN